ncbi:hypothetical protein F5Y05DRAFT_410565 [Hypoxylon sp. FL0543]|nr:hypothetical protein F5Y05DRAFT_410565 [Hypoxylon sp. FL0543]
MAKSSPKSSGSSSKTQKVRQSTSDKSTKSNMSPMERYLLEKQRHEQIAVGEPSDKSATQEELKRWNQDWQAASERKG